jgi:hypothetical protein
MQFSKPGAEKLISYAGRETTQLRLPNANLPGTGMKSAHKKHGMVNIEECFRWVNRNEKTMVMVPIHGVKHSLPIDITFSAVVIGPPGRVNHDRRRDIDG